MDTMLPDDMKGPAKEAILACKQVRKYSINRSQCDFTLIRETFKTFCLQ